MNLAQRSYDKELIDKDDVPFCDMSPNMKELNVINTLLGGHRITRRGIDFFLSRLPQGQFFTVAEIGCGGGYNLSSIRSYLKKRT